MKTDNSYQYVSMILEKGNFTEAAKALYISQPSLSQYISRLENEIGSRIFIPDMKPPTLTEAGRIFMAQESRMRSIHAQMLQQIQEIEMLGRGLVTIGASHYRSMTLLVEAIPRFKEKYPNIEIRVEEDKTDALAKAAAKNITDFSIVMLPLTNPKLGYIRLFDEEILVAMPPSHPLCRDMDISSPQEPPYPVLDFTCLKNDPFILIKRGQHLRNTYLELFQRFEFTPNIVMETDDMPTAQSLSAVGVGISLVPDHLVDAKIYTRRPIYFSIQQPVAKRVVVAAFDKRHPMSKAARAFLEEIKRVCN
ncbi:MAG: LysR family transcriptional regulator [Clostridia bacterium]|nr:LysR family transcriptional regulator [Clostridia bacterium]